MALRRDITVISYGSFSLSDYTSEVNHSKKLIVQLPFMYV